MWARCVTVSGPPEYLQPDHADVIARLQRHFHRQDGYLGSALLIDEQGGAIRSIGFWENREALEATAERAASLGREMARSIWMHRGEVSVERFEVVSLDRPPAVRVANTIAP